MKMYVKLMKLNGFLLFVDSYFWRFYLKIEVNGLKPLQTYERRTIRSKKL